MATYIQHQHILRPQYLGGGEWELKNLTDVTVLFGKNGSGKSILLRQWRNADPDGAHYVAPERTGEIQSNPSNMQSQLIAINRMSASSRNYVNDYRTQVVSRVQSYFLARGAHRSNLLPGRTPSEIEEMLTELIPDFEFQIKADDPPYVIRRLSTNEAVGGVDQLSSGEAQLVTISLDILTIAAIWELEKRNQRILLIDEPDAHIHPDLQIRFADFTQRVARNYDLQVIIATHSTTMLSALGQIGGAETSVIYLDRRDTTFQARSFNKVMKEMTTCLGGHALMGPLFNSPLLLVEGDDDYRIWSQVPRHHQISLAVVPANGDEIFQYQRTLEMIFCSITEPSQRPLGFALLDGDKRLPIPNPQSPQNFVRFVRLVCHESENLYLTNEVLADLETTWVKASRQIVERSGEFGDRADTLADAETWDRQNVDIKNVIEDVSRIIDPKNVHWTNRVGRCIGRKRPEGQLAEFLGQKVLDSLWPITE